MIIYCFRDNIVCIRLIKVGEIQNECKMDETTKENSADY